jgi:hypothetical protein
VARGGECEFPRSRSLWWFGPRRRVSDWRLLQDQPNKCLVARNDIGFEHPVRRGIAPHNQQEGLGAPIAFVECDGSHCSNILAAWFWASARMEVPLSEIIQPLQPPRREQLAQAVRAAMKRRPAGSRPLGWRRGLLDDREIMTWRIAPDQYPPGLMSARAGAGFKNATPDGRGNRDSEPSVRRPAKTGRWDVDRLRPP